MSEYAMDAQDGGPAAGEEVGRRRWPLPLVLIVVGALGTGTVLGWSLRNPESAPAYLELSEQHESIGADLEQALAKEAGYEETVSGLEEDLEQLEAPILELDEREEGLGTREGELDDREEELNGFSEELDEREGDLDTREEEVTGLETEAEENSFPGTGTFLVNDEISPGTYRSEDTSSCYWARLSGTGGTLDSIIANNFGAGRQVVTISGSDVAFETSSCGGWTRI
jgi:Rad3-related DNA helicase